MTRKIIPITCFVLAMLISGCRDSASSNSNDQINSSIKANQDNEGITIADTVLTSNENQPTIIAYYFHRTIRCHGCLEIEAAAKRVIETYFANQLADKKLIWMPFNLDEPGGEEFSKKFDVSMSTLVIVKEKDGNLIEYEKLEKVWRLIADKEGFSKYITEEIIEYSQ
jgi:hypothetical protein